MDWLTQKEFLMQWVKKYRYVALVLSVGLLLMILPSEPSGDVETPEHQERERSLQESLETILSQLDGAGKVRVLLTEISGEEIYYQTDSERSSSVDNQEESLQTVVEGEAGLIRRVDPPSYRGAVVLAQGADRASVRLSLVEAVADATGLPSSCITVLKMK